MNWAIIAGYLLGAAVCGRVAFVGQVNANGRRSDDFEETFVAVMIAVFWPFVVPLAAVIGLVTAIGWALSRPTRRERLRAAAERREREAAEAAEVAHKYGLPALGMISETCTESDEHAGN